MKSGETTPVSSPFFPPSWIPACAGMTENETFSSRPRSRMHPRVGWGPAPTPTGSRRVGEAGPPPCIKPGFFTILSPNRQKTVKNTQFK